MAVDYPTPQRLQTSDLANCGHSNFHHGLSSKNLLETANGQLGPGFDHLRFINDMDSKLQSNQPLSTIKGIYNPSGRVAQEPSDHQLFTNDSPKPHALNCKLAK